MNNNDENNNLLYENQVVESEIDWMVSCDKNELLSHTNNDDDMLMISTIDNEMNEQIPTGEMSLFTAFTHLIKSNIGAGLLALPQAVSRAGLVIGPVIMTLMAIPIISCILQLLKCSQVISKRNNKLRIGYAGTARYAFKPFLKENSKYMCYIINIFLISTQLGVCSTLFLFMAKTLHELTLELLKDVRIWITILYFIILPVSFISDLNCMLIFSIFANIFCLIGFIGTLVAVFSNITFHNDTKNIKSFNSILLFFTSIMYAYEGVPAVLPLYNKIRNKQKYSFTVFMSMIVVVCIMICMGFFGYMAYGEKIQPSITLNIPDTDGYNCVKMIYALGVFLTYFLQFFVASSIIIPSIQKRITDQFRCKIVERIVIFLCVTLTYIAAVAIPQLDNLISLVGAVCCSSLSFVFPPAIYIATFWYGDETTNQPPIKWYTMMTNIFIIILGIILCISGVTVTISKIIQDFYTPNLTT